MQSKLLDILQKQFKLESFRDGQEEIVQSAIDRKDTLVFMPTGGWKSLTYQLPGIYHEGVTLVISPLISLMKDQVDKLNELWIKTELINSTIDRYDIQIILNEISNPTTDVKFLYIAPERLNSPEFVRVISKIKISLVAIDEAHCISAWWHDFRPSYMKIRAFLDNLRKESAFPIMALTATATHKVREDIVERLWLDDFNSFTAWFDRKNITIIVREISKKEEKMEKVAEILDKTAWSGIIYCASRKAVKEVYDVLIQNWVKAWIYTWAMTPENREVEQNRFMNDEYKVMVATNAFGMWIDKKDIRFVIHYNLPGSIENYYQEVWRAWRDGKQSFWIVIASFQDTKIQEFFIENTYPSKEEILKLYDFLYAWNKEWEWKWKTILKTYFTISSESWIWSDMKVWSALRILEKYWILRRWVNSSEQEEGFRWRWMTLVQEKRKHSNLMVDWNHQDLLKTEAYFKLEQIKKLLFYPTCRKRFILTYFWDEEDLATLPDNCWTCDYCLEKEKFADMEVEDFVNLSVFALVLDVVKEMDAKIWVVMMTKFLRGSRDAKLVEWKMDKRENFWVLEDLTSELIQAVIEALISQDYLLKTEWKYPLLWITDTGRVAIVKDNFLKDDNSELQHYIRMKLWSSSWKKKTKTTKTKKERAAKWETYNETLALLKNWISLKEISEKRDMWLQTIEWHVVKLYEISELWLSDLLKFTSFSNLKQVKDVIINELSGVTNPLKPIKEKLAENDYKNISYFDIKMAIAMMDKKDL